MVTLNQKMIILMTKYKGKEYDFEHNLLFEGEYLYGQKRKGREYINGRLEYEGEYLFKKKYNGKGYDENGNIIYKLVNGNGTVREYDITGNLIFDGEYLNGKKWIGIVKEYDFEGNLKFEDVLINGGKKSFK